MGQRVRLEDDKMNGYENDGILPEVFRKIMVLNTARLKVVEPGLFEGGEGEGSC